MALRALIVDDEELARNYLRELLAAHEDVEIVGECRNGFEAVRAVGELVPDLLFLDVQMPKLDGFEVLELIEAQPAVIFVTAFDEYALKAFEAHAVDYLLKPFTAERLAEALDKTRRSSPGRPPAAPALSAAARPPGTGLKRLVVQDGGRIVVIPVDELDYVLAQDDYVALHSRGKSWLKHQTISGLADALPVDQFVRIHRSTIVRLDRLARIEPYTRDSRIAILRDGTELPVSRSGYKRLREILDM